MASLVQDLIKILEDETKCYKTLLEMADNKKDVIINGDLPGLQELTQHEQELAGLLLRLEKKRTAVTDDIALVTNQESQGMTVKKLIDLLKGQKEQSELIAVSDQLIQAVLPLQKANEQNEALLKQSLEFVDFTMNAIQSTRQPVASNNYEKKGYGASNYNNQSFFDSKQ